MARSTTKTRKPRTKSQVFSVLSDNTGLSKKKIAGLFDGLFGMIKADISVYGPGSFTVPGLMKISVKKKSMTKARKGINAFTGKEMMIKAMPARKVITFRPLRTLKDFVSDGESVLISEVVTAAPTRSGHHGRVKVVDRRLRPTKSVRMVHRKLCSPVNYPIAPNMIPDGELSAEESPVPEAVAPAEIVIGTGDDADPGHSEESIYYDPRTGNIGFGKTYGESSFNNNPADKRDPDEFWPTSKLVPSDDS